MEKSFRIHTNITGDTLLNVNMKQDFDFLEILSLKLRQKDAYRLHSSNYGVIVGRVLANDAFGVPNAKVSVFIERDTTDPNVMRDIYPYSEVMSTDKDGIRYNLLPDYSDDTCYRVVGTFPRKRYLLDDNIQLEVYDKYWKYSTVTNQAGDYMLFGVPEGSQQIHVDIDLSDIGILSQRPRDFVFKGYDINEFDSPSQFKESTNLDGLQQIISQNKTTVVYPFWGDPSNGIAAITRCDVQVNYKFEPTCVFMGSIVSDNEGNSIGHKCAPSVDSGMNNQLVAGEGTIEMIRKTVDGLVEEFPIKGNALIDSDGVWCYQIPMNLDYVGTDEYGNIVPTDNPSRGIPTRTQVRFRISKTESGDEGFSRHTAKYLVPMNPVMDEKHVVPTTQATTGQEMERMYNFGSNTPQSCFRDLYWNNVYSVKNYIPKVQVAHRAYSTNYGALKGANLVDNQNPIPFNKLRVDIPFTYMIVCIIFTIVMIIIHFINTLIWIIQEIRGLFIGFKIFGKRIGLYPFKLIIPKFGCIPLNAGLGDGSNVAYYPGCHCPGSEACRNAECPEGMEGGCTKSSNNHDLKDKIQQALALDYKIIKLDFYQDWLNGALYMPLWFWRKRKKKTFLFFTISRAKNEFCSCDKEYSRLKTYVTCDINYRDNSLGTDNSNTSERDERWHKSNSRQIRYRNGLIKGVENKDGLTAYYYAAFQATTNDPIQMPIERRTKPFQFARLYATDIILLGNLNESNLYGIPQFFKSLPSTTANIPPIATIQEALTDDKTDDSTDTISSDGSESGTTITTGMDWGYYGDSQTPLYKDGLFIDLTCTYAGTKAKSCINVERISELGVNLDSTYSMTYAHDASDLKTGMIDSDGFISKLELDDLDNRATFATLNHMGFLPQDYQDSISAYTTQIQDDNTGYLIPKFKYIYPVDFDGRLQPIMKRYKKGFEQALYDERDESYITFRLGAENATGRTASEDNLEHRIRHFYYDKNGYDMPLYNNSFYFYFGINKGNTAIEKFNNLFYSQCFQRNEAPFSFTIESMGKSYCPSVYGNENKAYNGYGYIRFTSDDIIPPFSYTLYDSSSNIVVPTETGMTNTDFVIGGKINSEGKIEMNENGVIKTQMTDSLVEGRYYGSGLTNQAYVLEVTDSNGKRLSERIELKIPKISINFDTEALKTKFYSTGSTRMDYICTDENQFYGLIRLKGFSLDGSYYYITKSTVLSYDSEKDAYKIWLSGVTVTDATEEGKPLTGHPATAIVRVAALDSPNVGWVRDCMCDSGNTVYRVNGQHSKIADAEEFKYWFSDKRKPVDEEKLVPEGEESAINHIPTFFVYQPNRFTLTISQYCEVNTGEWRELEENTTSDIATVANGLNFNTFLNDMPVKFMLGSVTDSSAATVANQSYFYRDSVVTNETDSHISGWYGIHQEDSYRWEMSENQVLKRNEEMWSDYVDIGGDITRSDIKARVLEFKFNSMFSLASAAYIIDDPTTFYYEARGGVTPTLYRDVIPKYSDLTAMKSVYVLSDDNMASGQMIYPNIVGNNYAFQDGDDNYIRHTKEGPNFNKYYNIDTTWIGNYFAAFTNNGGYVSKTEIDRNIKVAGIPTGAKVSPKTGGEKRLGRDEEGRISTTFSPAATKDRYNPYLRAEFVDRRLDFDLVLIAPCVANNYVNLYETIINPEDGTHSENPKEKIWRSARISGTTYNGVEMSYDREYNTISADTTIFYTIPSSSNSITYTSYDAAFDAALEIVTSYIDEEDHEKKAKELIDDSSAEAVENRRLEYSYYFAGGDSDAKTIYNIPSAQDTIWEEDAYGTEPKPGQILKRFYEATFVGSDIRNYFWSDFNKTKLSVYAATRSITDIDYVYQYPVNYANYYNGDFNRVDVVENKNYPTRRFIDVGNIVPGGTYDLDITNCSYSMAAQYNDDHTITSEVQEANGISIHTSFDSPISFLPPSEGSDDYANADYHQAIGTVDGLDKGKYCPFEIDDVSIMFVINPVSNDDFDVYTAQPRMIKVLPYITPKGYDGISHIKTVTPDGEIDATGSIYRAIEDVTIHLFSHTMDDVWGFNAGEALRELDTLVPSGTHKEEMKLKDGTLTDSVYYFKSDGGNRTYYTSDSSEFQSIKYFLNNQAIVDNTSMFAFLIERQYISKEEDNLKKNLKTFEFSEIYDIRSLLLKIDEELTYVEKMSGATIDFNGETQPPEQSGGEGGDGGNDEPAEPTSVNGSGNTFYHVQTMSFDLYFPNEPDPQAKKCETFGDTQTMSYTLKLRNNNEDIYELSPSETSAVTDTNITHDQYRKIILTFRWTQDMGIMADNNWQRSTYCQLIARTGGNFIYRLKWFQLTWNENSQPGYNAKDKKSSGTDGEGGSWDNITDPPQKHHTKTKIKER